MYALTDAGSENGLIVAKIAREAGNRWGFHALGLPSRGRTYKDSLPQIQEICRTDTRKLAAASAPGSQALWGFNPSSGSDVAPPVPRSCTCCKYLIPIIVLFVAFLLYKSTENPQYDPW